MKRTNRPDQSGDNLHGQTGQANQERVYMKRTNRPDQSGDR